jgi:hypothetical protein
MAARGLPAMNLTLIVQIFKQKYHTRPLNLTKRHEIDDGLPEHQTCAERKKSNAGCVLPLYPLWIDRTDELPYIQGVKSIKKATA